MKINKIELFILNYFYKNPETPRSYGEVVIICRKEYPKAATRTIRYHFDELTKKGFIQKKRHDLYRLPNIPIKGIKRYNTDAFIMRIIDAYDLGKRLGDYKFLQASIEEHLEGKENLENRIYKVLWTKYEFKFNPNRPKKDKDKLAIRVVLNALRLRFLPEKSALNFEVIRKLQKGEKIDLESIETEIKNVEREQLEHIDLALGYIDYYLQTSPKDSPLYYFFNTLKPVIESERKEKRKYPIDWRFS